jgi:1-deoxy-D-xylulose-5-phosphate reductoisomerase
MPVVLNAANEVAVEAFLQERLAFTGIADVIAAAMSAHTPIPATTLEAVRSVDGWARGFSRGQVDARGIQRVRISS